MPSYDSFYGQLRRAIECEYVWEMEQEVEAISLRLSITMPSTVYAVQFLLLSDLQHTFMYYSTPTTQSATWLRSMLLASEIEISLDPCPLGMSIGTRIGSKEVLQ